MKVGYYKGRKFLLNEFFMEIWEEHPDGKLTKKRNFHKWESLVKWEKVENILGRKENEL